MSDFTTSNGVTIHCGPADIVTYSTEGNRELRDIVSYRQGSPLDAALAEWYRHREDERIGRWRWPENPDYVVYPKDKFGQTVVVHEQTGHNATFLRGQVNPFGSDFARCAIAFFKAHPERKPWDDAKEGEVWVIRTSRALNLGEVTECPAIFQAGKFRDHGGSWDMHDITDARRIWPEEAE